MTTLLARHPALDDYNPDADLWIHHMPGDTHIASVRLSAVESNLRARCPLCRGWFLWWHGELVGAGS